MLRSETIAVFRDAALDEDEDEDNLFVPREKTTDKVEREEEEYRDYLAREVGEDLTKLVTIEEGIGAREGEGEHGSETEDIKEPETDEGKKKKKSKKKKEGKGKEKVKETDQEFLMKYVQAILATDYLALSPCSSFIYSYILNRGWIDRSVNRVPTYKEVVATTSQGAPVDDSGSEKPDELLSGDEEFDEIADRFETSYNFRFEEP